MIGIEKTRLLANSLTFLLALLLLAACGGSEDSESRTVVRLSGWANSPDEIALLDTQIAEFESLHPDIKVKYEPFVGDYIQKLQVLFASKTEPDVFYLDSKDTARMTYYDVLEPLDEYLEEAGEDMSDFYENLLRSFRGADGKLYGLPKGFSTMALYYNEEFFSSAGIASPPADWVELLEVSKKIAAQGIVPLCFSPDMKTLMLFAGLAGGSVVRGPKTIAFRDSTARRGFETLLGLLNDDPALARLPQDFGGTWTGDAFAKKKAAMIFEGMWLVPYLKTRAPDMRYGVAPIPKMDRRSNVLITVAFVVSKRSQHKREAVALARYLTSRKGLMHVSRLGLEVPSRKSVVNSDFLGRFPKLKPFITAVGHSTPYRFGLEGSRLEEELMKAFEAARLKQMPLEESLTRAADKLSRFYEAGP